MRMIAAFVFSALLALSAGLGQAAERSVLEIVTKTGVHSFSVEVVDNDADRAKGRIHRIAENTVPLSLEQVPSRGPVRGVLEVIAGTSRKLGIAPGDRVAHPIFSGR